MDEDKLYTTTEAASLLITSLRRHPSRAWVNELVKRGKLKAEKHGPYLFIRRSEIERYNASVKNGPGRPKKEKGE